MTSTRQDTFAGTVTFNQWLPTRQQISNAAQLRLDAAIDGEEIERTALAGAPATTMLQGLGLIIVIGVLAGLPPFLFNWFLAARAGTTVPLFRNAGSVSRRAWDSSQGFSPFEVLQSGVQSLAGLDTVLPGWLAAGLSAFGIWINGPLNWLAFWVVYGLGVLVICHLLGATTTLQRFYASTSYAVTPLLLSALAPIPCIGPVVGLVAFVWSIVIYGLAVRVTTGLKWARIVIAMVAPLAVGALLALLVAIATTASLMRLFF